ncbi:uncharacterized protein LOC134274267 [Saccostrea cucullata]|uniref:uncharacterized protein LOC134274267 n=1 Tax=Saccostrea cuccullata TaxID=36930 RepID=UPI002ED444E4
MHRYKVFSVLLFSASGVLTSPFGRGLNNNNGFLPLSTNIEVLVGPPPETGPGEPGIAQATKCLIKCEATPPNIAAVETQHSPVNFAAMETQQSTETRGKTVNPASFIIGFPR